MQNAFPPVVLSIIASVVRFALGGLFAYLVQQGIIQEGQVAELIAGATVAISSLAWIVWTNVKKHREMNTALASKQPSTLEAVREQVKAGEGAPAVVKADEIPVVIGGTPIPKTGHE